MADPRYSRSQNRRARPIFKCPTCDLGTFDVEELKTHLKTHEQGKAFACSSCGLGFTSYAGLQEHLHWHAMGILNKLSVSVPGVLETPPVGSTKIIPADPGEASDNISVAEKHPDKADSTEASEILTNPIAETVKTSAAPLAEKAVNILISDPTQTSSGSTPSPSNPAPVPSNATPAPANSSTAPSNSSPVPSISVPPTSNSSDTPSDTAPTSSNSALTPSDSGLIPSSSPPTPSDSTPTPSDTDANSQAIEPLYFKINFDEINLVKIMASETEEKEKEMIPVGAKKRPFKTIYGLKRYPCSICGKKYGNFSSMQKHLVDHRTEGKLVCEICGKCVKEKDRLKTHYQTHVEKGDWRRKCEICGKVLKNPTSFTAHMKRLHAEPKPDKDFLCEVCGYRSKDAQYHEQHLKLHSGIKPYTCKICNKSFARSDYLTRHMPTHMEEKPFQCAKCGKGFGRKQYLEKHVSKSICERPGYMESLAKRNSKKAKGNANNSQTNVSNGKDESVKCPENQQTKITKKNHKRKKDSIVSPTYDGEESSELSSNTTAKRKKSRKCTTNFDSEKESNDASNVGSGETEEDTNGSSLSENSPASHEKLDFVDNSTSVEIKLESDILENDTQGCGEKPDLPEMEGYGHEGTDLLEIAMRDNDIMDFDIQAESVLENNLPSSQEETDMLELLFGMQDLE